MQPLTDLAAVDLVRLIAAGEVSACDVVEAHLDRIDAVNPRLNAVVVVCREAAMAEARRADERQSRGATLGPLHGLPITVKEFFDVAGLPTTAGIVPRADHRAATDAEVVARLLSAGAILLGKTNAAQLGLMMETDNPLYGRTNNPWDESRSPGGSSGGEAAIVAARGSPLGLGSDGGGSIRQPAHCCGIAGLKPTSRRLSMVGHWTYASYPDDWAQPGPMARTVADLELAWRVLKGPSAIETLEPAAANPPRRVGVYDDDGHFRPAPGIRRAVRLASDALARRGLEIVSFRPPELDEAWRLYMSLLYADGCDDLRRELASSPCDWRVGQILKFGGTPAWRRMLAAMRSAWSGQRHFARLYRAAPRQRRSRVARQQLRTDQEAYRRRFLAAMDELKLDAILCPPNALAAPRHGNVAVNLASLYTSLYNLLGFPAGVVPVTRIGPDEESDRPKSRDGIEQAARHSEAGSAGLPVGVQIVAPPEREDLVLEMMATLEEAFRGSPDYPERPRER